MTRFGNTLAVVSRGIAAMTVLGLVLGCICVAASVSHQTIVDRWSVCVLLTFMPPSFFLLSCTPTLVFSIHIEAGRVKHMLLNRFVLSDLPTADFERLEWVRSPLPVKIVFTGNRRIHFVGAHLRVIGELREALASAKKTANKALEPTPGSVTPRAEPRVAPAPGVAHL
jgi:hypothetical protein